jgi:ribose transport system permease protein
MTGPEANSETALPAEKGGSFWRPAPGTWLPAGLRSWADYTAGSSVPIWVILAVVFVTSWIVVAAGGGNFATVPNVQNILQRSVALGLVTVGQTLVVLAGSLDLSVAYVVSVAAMVASVVMAGDPARIPIAVAAALAAGALAGLANGLVITQLRVNAFIATLGVAWIVRGALNATFNNFAGKVPDVFQGLGYDVVALIPVSVFLLAGVAAAAWFLMHRTRFGHHVYAVGGDAEAARLSGVRPARVLIAVHVLSGLCAATSGVFLVSRLGSAAPWVGPDGGYDLESIAAVVLGGVALAGGKGRLLGALAAVAILAVVDSVFNYFQADPFLRTLIRGVIIIGAVALYAYRSEREPA